MDRYDLRLTQLRVTPSIERAVEILRAAVPAERIGHFDLGPELDGWSSCQSATIENPRFRGTRKRQRWTEVTFTDEQRSAVRLLTTIAGHYVGLLRIVHELSETDSPDRFPEFGAALRCLNDDIKRKLNIEISFRNVTVYR